METYRWLDRSAEPVSDVDDAGYLDVEDAFRRTDIEYWVRRGNRLVPATEEEIAQIREWERESLARARLFHMKEAKRHARRWWVRLFHIEREAD